MEVYRKLLLFYNFFAYRY